MHPQVLYFDNHLVAVSKPSGMATHEDGVNSFSLREWVHQWVREKFQKPGKAFVVPVHRLDKGTSGVVLFAKTDKALSRLAKCFRERSVQKIYLARVIGSPPNNAKLSDWVSRDGSKSFICLQSDAGAQEALMSFSVLKRFNNACELLIYLHTGRHHQIRLQLSHRGWPIIGDVRYGGPKIDREGIMLHHASLHIHHPVTGQLLQIEAPLPEDWLLS